MCPYIALRSGSSTSAMHLVVQALYPCPTHGFNTGSAGAQAAHHCETRAGLALLGVQQGAQPDAQQLRLLGHVAACDRWEHLQKITMLSGAPFTCMCKQLCPGSV